MTDEALTAQEARSASLTRDELLEPVDIEARGVLKHAFAGSTSTLRAIDARYLRKLL